MAPSPPGGTGILQQSVVGHRVSGSDESHFTFLTDFTLLNIPAKILENLTKLKTFIQHFIILTNQALILVGHIRSVSEKLFYQRNFMLIFNLHIYWGILNEMFCLPHCLTDLDCPLTINIG